MRDLRNKSDKRRPFIKVVENADRWKWNVLIGIPTMGQVHILWSMGYQSMIMPMNFSMGKILAPVGMVAPLRFHTAEAQNIIVHEAIAGPIEWDWLLLLEDDVIPPPHTLIRLSKWVRQDRYPIISGLYHLKSSPVEPMVFRGRGNGSWTGWQKGPDIHSKKAKLPVGVKPEEVAFCDGVPTGCLLISMKLLQVAWDESPAIKLNRKLGDGGKADIICREIFITRREAGLDPEKGGYYMRMGTSDLEFCDRVVKDRWMEKAGYKAAAKLKFPFVVDLGINCNHIDLQTGAMF